MYHVDVKYHEAYECFIVATSIDGAGWSPQYTLQVYPNTTDRNHTQTKTEAERLARAMIVGIRLAGGEARGTSGGYAL